MAIKRTKQSDKPKRVRKRNTRTEVSSSSSSSDTESPDSDSSDGEGKLNKKPNVAVQKSKPMAAKDELSRDNTPDSTSDVSMVDDAPDLDLAKADEGFTSLYLRQMTTEFAEDLDKIRSAGDFNNRSIGMLVGALKQGSSCFSKNERIHIGKCASASSV